LIWFQTQARLIIIIIIIIIINVIIINVTVEYNIFMSGVMFETEIRKLASKDCCA